MKNKIYLVFSSFLLVILGFLGYYLMTNNGNEENKNVDVETRVIQSDSQMVEKTAARILESFQEDLEEFLEIEEEYLPVIYEKENFRLVNEIETKKVRPFANGKVVYAGKNMLVFAIYENGFCAIKGFDYEEFNLIELTEDVECYHANLE